MKRKIIKIFLGICLVLILITEPENEAPKGMACFKECSQICQENDSKVYTFTTIKNTCGCTCFNGYQTMFKI